MVKSVKKINKYKLKVLFVLKKSFGYVSLPEFAATCSAEYYIKRAPGIWTGGFVHYHPHKNDIVLVTVDRNGNITSYTKMSPKLYDELQKNGLKNISFIIGHAQIQNRVRVKNNLQKKQVKQTIEELNMEIYGRLDTRISSRRAYLDDINKFLHKATSILIKKHKLDIQMIELERQQMGAAKRKAKVTAITNALNYIKNLNGKVIIDYEGRKLRKLSELKQIYIKAIETSMEYQKENYASEKDRKTELLKLKRLLNESGTAEQKNDMNKNEIRRARGEYRYYKEYLDNSSVWCMIDRNISQKKPLFFPKSIFVERLYKQYKTELINSKKPYNSDEFSKRVRKLEKKSQKIKSQSNLTAISNHNLLSGQMKKMDLQMLHQ